MLDVRGNTLVQNITGLAVSLLVPLAWSVAAVPLLPVGIAAGVALGAVFLWRMNIEYRDAITRELRAGGGVNWLRRHLTIALAGALVTAAGGAALWMASEANSRGSAAVGVALVIAGVIPVIQVIRVDVNDDDPPPSAPPMSASSDRPLALSPLTALAINTGLAAATLLPAAMLLAGPATGAEAAGFGVALWIGTEYVRRKRRWSRLAVRLGGVIIAAACVVLITSSPTATRSVGLLLGAVAIGLVFVVGGGRAGAIDEISPRVHTWLALHLFAIGTVLLLRVVQGDVPLLLVGAAIAAPVAFGFSLVARGDGLLLAAATGVFIVWAVGDHTTQPQPLVDADAAHVVAAFGDSYMAGEGIGDFYDDTNTGWEDGYAPADVSGCRRSPVAYPALARAEAEARLGASVSLDFRACSGAKAISDETFATFDAETATFNGDQLDEEARRNTLFGQFMRFEAATVADPSAPGADDVDVVLLSLGGNDSGFSTIGAACFMPGSCSEAVESIRRDDLEIVEQRVSIALTRARSTFPDTPILVVAYPQMFGDDTDRCDLPFAGDEVDTLRVFVTGLNAAVGKAIATARADGADIRHVATPTNAFAGERFCELDAGGDLRPARAMNVLDPEPTEGRTVLDRLQPTVFIHNTFHPTARGHELLTAPIADAIVAALRDEPLPTPAPTVVAGCDPAGLDACMSAAAEKLADAAHGTAECTDLDNYIRCVGFRLLRQLVLPLAALVMAGRSLGIVGHRGGWLETVVDWGTAPYRPRLVKAMFGLAPTTPPSQR